MRQRLRNIVKRLENISPFYAATFRALRSSAHRVFGITAWFIASQHSILGATRKKDRRVLMIYDLTSQPYSIGDIIIFQEAGLVLLEENGCAAVDFALVYNPAHPAVPDPVLSSITEDNCLFHLASILPVAQVNQRLGSLFLFNSHDHLERFVADNMDRYLVWPSAGTYLSREYLLGRIFNEIFARYYRKNNRLPPLYSRHSMLSWSFKFMHKHVFPSLPVTVQLRRNSINPGRNSNYDVWLEFFASCNERYPAKFIIIGAESEMDERFKQYPNVLMAKDFCTSVELDLALINSAAVHMGAASGPGAMAYFSSTPFLLCNAPIETLLNLGYIQNGNFTQAFFSNSAQQITVIPETLDMLNEEFEKMWAVLDKKCWDKIINQPSNNTSDIYTWLR